MDFNDQNIIILGAGFIGSELCNKLVHHGGNVKLVSLTGGSKFRIPESVEVVACDINDNSALAELFENQKVEYIFNTAGYVNHSSWSGDGVNLVKTHLISTMQQFSFISKEHLKRYIYIGSADEYPASLNGPASEDMREEPRTPYAFAKTAATHFLQMLWRNEGWPTVVGRVFLAYGPGQLSNRLIPSVLLSASTAGVIKTTHGEQVRDFCHIDDLTNAILRMAKQDNVEGQIYNLGSGSPYKVKDIVEIISQRYSSQVQFGALPTKPNEAHVQYANTDKTKRELEWVPEVAIHEGLTTVFQSR